jgi:3-methyl-2-oxobutanoate hydroxymethyltransferase
MTLARPVTVSTLASMKLASEKITMLTAYDYSFGHLLDQSGVDVILVGDTLGMVMQGHTTTVPVTVKDCVYHCRCVSRGVERAMLVADLPFGAYQASIEQAWTNSVRLMQDGRAHMVKLEGGELMAETIDHITSRGIPVCGHIGLTPQSVHQLGGFKVQGRDQAVAKRLKRDARAQQEAGASLIVLEAVPAVLAKEISQSLDIPTIGIGAGVHCDGQVLVLQDMLGLYPRKSPKFSRDFMQGNDSISHAIEDYVACVKDASFPAVEHSFE